MHLIWKSLGALGLCVGLLAPALAQSEGSTPVPLPPAKSATAERSQAGTCGAACTQACDTQEQACTRRCEPVMASCMRSCDRHSETCELECKDRFRHCNAGCIEPAKTCRQVCKC